MPAQTIVERFHERVRKSLLSAEYGHGQKIAILSNNRPEWHIADVASMCIGGASAAIYQTNSPEQVRYIVDHSESRFIFVDGSDQLEKVLKIRAEIPNVQKVITFDPVEDADKEFVMSWKDFLAVGKDISDAQYE